MEVSDMKKFLINIAIFFAMVAVVDFSLGKVLNYLQANVAGGRTGAEYYVCKKATEDIIIMGSSRASHHYVPEIISKKFGMSCFNAGQDGNGIILQYGRWKMLSERYAPKLLIYDITMTFDLEVNDNMIYVDRLKLFCNDNSILNYISSLFPVEKYKLMSNLYRFNYKFIEMLSDCIRGDDYAILAGYLPEFGNIRKEMKERQIDMGNSIEIDSVKFSYLKQLVLDAKDRGTEVVFVISPCWKGGNLSLSAYQQIVEFSLKYGIQFIEYISSEMSNNPDYFKDSMHLNDVGAEAFTESLVSRIRL